MVALGAEGFTTLVGLLQDAELVATLQSAGPFTVFAPTDEAFAKLPAETLAAVKADKELSTKSFLPRSTGKLQATDVLAGKTACSQRMNYH